MGFFDIFRSKKKTNTTTENSTSNSVRNEESPRSESSTSSRAVSSSSYRIVQVVSHGTHAYPNAQCLLVLANSLSLGHREKCNQTESFLVPQSEWNRVVRIKNNHLIWHLDLSDFTKEKIWFPGLACDGWLDPKRIVWRHRSVPGSNGNFTVNTADINEIPGWDYKIEQLKSQYYSGGWTFAYPSFREYVISLAEGDDVENFWGWLFDNNMLARQTYWTLPTQYKALFRVFLAHCTD